MSPELKIRNKYLRMESKIKYYLVNMIYLRVTHYRKLSEIFPGRT